MGYASYCPVGHGIVHRVKRTFNILSKASSVWFGYGAPPSVQPQKRCVHSTVHACHASEYSWHHETLCIHWCMQCRGLVDANLTRSLPTTDELSSKLNVC